jgi:hypothetical protein
MRTEDFIKGRIFDHDIEGRLLQVSDVIIRSNKKYVEIIPTRNYDLHSKDYKQVFCLTKNFLEKTSIVNNEPLFGNKGFIMINYYVDYLEKNNFYYKVFLELFKKSFSRNDVIQEVTRVDVVNGVNYYKLKGYKNLIPSIELIYDDPNFDFFELSLMKKYFGKVILNDRKVNWDDKEIIKEIEKIKDETLKKLNKELKRIVVSKEGESNIKQNIVLTKNYYSNLINETINLKNNNKIINVVFDKTQKIFYITTKLIKGYLKYVEGRRPLGHYLTKIFLENRNYRYSLSIVVNRLEGVSTFEDAHHHCVITNGDVCFGEYSDQKRSASLNGLLNDYVNLVLLVLENYTIQPDVDPDDWYNGLGVEWINETENLIEKPSGSSIISCADCGEDYPEFILKDGYCYNCIKGTKKCDRCGNRTSDYYDFNDNLLCDDCYYDETRECDHCGNRFDNDDLNEHDLCEDCESNYFICEECEERNHIDNENEGLCPYCYEKRQEDDNEESEYTSA